MRRGRDVIIAFVISVVGQTHIQMQKTYSNPRALLVNITKF